MKVFNEKGQELNKQEIKEEVPKYWREYLGKGKNEIDQVWNEGKRVELQEKWIKEIKSEPSFIIFKEGVFKVEQPEQEIIPMKLKAIEKDTMNKKLEKVKNKKSPGPNLLKPELYKELGNSDFCTKTMARVYENQMHSDKIPKSWKGTRTKVIKKIKKPMVKDFRPIALANISYKLLMSIVKDQIEEHIEQNNLIKHNQTGFTKGGRKEDNLFVLQYLVEKTYKQDKPLIVISIDYSKAYDSIDRKRMIETMIKYKIHPNIIDIVSKVYQDDFTNLVFGEHEEKINITSGIKQGCTGSTTLFKLITYEIIKEMEKHGE